MEVGPRGGWKGRLPEGLCSLADRRLANSHRVTWHASLGKLLSLWVPSEIHLSCLDNV